VVRDGRVSYKILSKAPGAILVLRTETVITRDDTVMPPVDTTVERTSRIHIAPTARLSDFTAPVGRWVLAQGEESGTDHAGGAGE
jgi:hypothetical protein